MKYAFIQLLQTYSLLSKDIYRKYFYSFAFTSGEMQTGLHNAAFFEKPMKM